MVEAIFHIQNVIHLHCRSYDFQTDCCERDCLDGSGTNEAVQLLARLAGGTSCDDAQKYYWEPNTRDNQGRITTDVDTNQPFPGTNTRMGGIADCCTWTRGTGFAPIGEGH